MYLHRFLFSMQFWIFRIANGFFRFATAQSNDCFAGNVMYPGERRNGAFGWTSHSLQLSSLVTATSSQTGASPSLCQAWICPRFHCASLTALPRQACAGSQISSPVRCLVHFFFYKPVFFSSKFFSSGAGLCVGAGGAGVQPPAEVTSMCCKASAVTAASPFYHSARFVCTGLLISFPSSVVVPQLHSSRVAPFFFLAAIFGPRL